MLRLKTKTYQVPSADQDINTAFLSYNSPLSYKALSPSLFSSLSLCSVLLWTTYLSFLTLALSFYSDGYGLDTLCSMCSMKLHTSVLEAEKSYTMSLFIETLWNISVYTVQPTAWIMNVNSSRLRVKSLKAGRD